jgi:hypothetical protein
VPCYITFPLKKSPQPATAPQLAWGAWLLCRGLTPRGGKGDFYLDYILLFYFQKELFAKTCFKVLKSCKIRVLSPLFMILISI